MPVARDASIVKIAVTPFGEGSQLMPQLIEFDQRQPLTQVVSEICDTWNLEGSDKYALKFTEPSFGYVTEKNRGDVKNGYVLKLSQSVSPAVSDILEILKSGSLIDQTRCLQGLVSLSADLTFALEFISKSGLDLLIKMIEDDKCTGERLESALKSFIELMDHGSVSWEILTETFITRNIGFTNQPYLSKSITESALSILENVVQNSTKSAIVENSVTFDNLLENLRDSSPIIQQNTIALINALFMKADMAKKKTITEIVCTKKYRSVIFECVLNPSLGTEMTHQLSILQWLTLSMLEPRMSNRNVDQEAQDMIKELRRIAFEGEGNDSTDTAKRQHNPSQHYYKKLGFKCDINPAQDFMESSLLALDCMYYMATNYSHLYKKIVHENSCRADEYECPFGRTSIELVKLICEILKIGEPQDQVRDFHPLFFTHDHPFEEFFRICIVELNKTWKDMRATSEDFPKVFDVVREQITRNLADRPREFENFRIKMNEMSYSKIQDLRQQELAAKKVCESTASAIVSLKEKIRPEIVALIREQRLLYLVEGTRFSRYQRGQRSKDKFWYVRLSSNHKVFHYGDCDEKNVPTQEELKTELRVNDMKQLLVNKECPHIKEMKGRKPTTLFSIAYDDNGVQKTLDFVAPDEPTFYYWIDGELSLVNLLARR